MTSLDDYWHEFKPRKLLVRGDERSYCLVLSDSRLGTRSNKQHHHVNTLGGLFAVLRKLRLHKNL